MDWEDFKTEIITVSEDKARSLFPDTLYKYRDWGNANHRSILTNQEVYFSSVSQFIDPHDCRFPVEFDFSYPTAEEYYFHDIRVVHNRTWTDDQVRSMARYFYEEGFGTPEKQSSKKEDFYRLFNSRHGILCLCKSSDVPSMWDEYANNFNGFCVGISLADHLSYIRMNHIFGGNVNYVDRSFPPLKYIMSHKLSGDQTTTFYMRLIHTKYENFKNENEYRLVKIFEDGNYRVIQNNERVFRLPKKAFTQIIFGHKMNKHAIHQIIATCDAQHLKVNYKIASPDGKGGVFIEPYLLSA